MFPSYKLAQSPHGLGVLLGSEVERLGEAGFGRVISGLVGVSGAPAVDLHRDLAALERQCQALRAAGENVVLIVFDPLNSYLHGVNMNDQIELRDALDPVTAFAERMGITVLSIAHDVKGAGYATSVSKIAGSGAYGQVARGAFMIDHEDADDKDSLRRFMCDKMNIAPKPPTLGFRTKGKTIGGGINTSYAAWEEEPLDIGAEEAMHEAEDGHTSANRLGEAKDFLGTLLLSGAVPVPVIEADAAAAGLSKRTLKRAKEEMKIRSTKNGMTGHWSWEMPGRGQTVH